MQNHQESEWWLSVQDKCIYGKNSGEWSQFSQLNLGRLRFSTTPRIVPRPYRFSHRIQVTQRTDYHEVAAKVNIVGRSNVGFTHIHKYTSGIGLSFLALPRDSQRLTGEIPALPKTIPFDFEEPADLIIAIDGSVIFGVVYHGWVLATKEETILLHGGGPDDRIQSLMTSYRSWNASERDLRRLSKNRQMNVEKLCHNYWHTGSRHVIFYGGERPCCFGQETKEDWIHILNCPSLDASYHQVASWQKVKKDMQMWRLPADFWTAIEKGLHHLPSDLEESTSPTLPFQISVNPIRNHLRAAFQEQKSIKWTNLLKGCMSHRWQQFATAHVH
jgi:hypothetical protein